MDRDKLVQWILRFAVAGEFAGHGAFALQGKEEWAEWFVQLKIADLSTAFNLLFLIGLLDMLVAIIVLVKPIRVALLWAAFWAFVTALVCPLVGEPIWDFVERSANIGAPLALLFFLGWPNNLREWVK